MGINKSGTVAAVEAMKSAIDSFRFLSWDNTGENFQQWVQQSVQH